MIHPISFVDIIIGVLIADGILYALRSTLHFISQRNSNKDIIGRLDSLRPRAAALDQYRIRQERDPHAPLG